MSFAAFKIEGDRNLTINVRAALIFSVTEHVDGFARQVTVKYALPGNDTTYVIDVEGTMAENMARIEAAKGGKP